MIFADLVFIYMFLPVNIGLYYICKNKTYRNLVLILFSLFFYSWGEPVWVCLLIFSSLVDFTCGLVIEKHRNRFMAKFAVFMSLLINLGLLGIFKYSGFFGENINLLFGSSLPVMKFALPVGISFYTFQTISYTVDVYRDKTEVQHSFLNFLMYVSLYFQLVAGPIVRYRDVAREIDSRQENFSDFSKGLTRFCIGLTKKVMIANVAGKLSETYLKAPEGSLTVLGAWFGAVLFTLQIYYDFSGYSDMAIGLGNMFGFHFLENFNYPYIAKTASEFWRRWHISLGNFFKDYVYIPLGGNRHHQILNLLVVWFLTGLWHGASWNFIVWGLFYCVFIMIEKLIGEKNLKKVPSFIMHIYLLVIVIVGWMLFYFEDLSEGLHYISVMFGNSGALYNANDTIDFYNNVIWAFVAILFSTPVVKFCENKLVQKYEWIENTVSFILPIVNIILLILCTSFLTGQSYNPFLYYKF